MAAHVGKPEDAESCVAETVARFGGLDILVNNAGTNPYFGPMIDIDVVRAQKTFEVNQLSVLVWTAAAVKAGLRGSVINIASIGGLGVEPGIGWYNVTKAAVLTSPGSSPSSSRPTSGSTRWPRGWSRRSWPPPCGRARARSAIAAHIPLRRLGLPDDIATAALFLASDASSWMTGQTIVVDGGTTAQPSGGVG